MTRLSREIETDYYIDIDDVKDFIYECDDSEKNEIYGELIESGFGRFGINGVDSLLEQQKVELLNKLFNNFTYQELEEKIKSVFGDNIEMMS